MMTTIERAERRLPTSPDSERTILGTILQSSDAYIDAVSRGLTVQDFWLDCHQRIFTHMLLMGEAGRHIDLITLSEELKQSKQLEAVGGMSYLASLTDGVPGRRDLRALVTIVHEQSMRRKLIHACNSAIGEALDGTSAQRSIDGLGESLLQIQSESDDAPAERVLSFTDAVYGDWVRIADSDAEVIGLTTGINSIDLPGFGTGNFGW
jgi:replicative DNA helicase